MVFLMELNVNIYFDKFHTHIYQICKIMRKYQKCHNSIWEIICHRFLLPQWKRFKRLFLWTATFSSPHLK